MFPSITRVYVLYYVGVFKTTPAKNYFANLLVLNTRAPINAITPIA